MGKHAFKLLLVQPAKNACRDHDHGTIGATTGREGVGHIGVSDRDSGFLHVRHRGKTVNDPVQLRCLLGRDLASAHRT